MDSNTIITIVIAVAGLAFALFALNRSRASSGTPKARPAEAPAMPAPAAAPRAARIGITLQALKAAALYQLGPPGRRRCHASEIPWRSRQLSVGRDDPARPPQFSRWR